MTSGLDAPIQKPMTELEGVGEALGGLFSRLVNIRERLEKKRVQMFGSYPAHPKPSGENKMACEPGMLAAIKGTVRGLEHTAEEINEHLRELESL